MFPSSPSTTPSAAAGGVAAPTGGAEPRRLVYPAVLPGILSIPRGRFFGLVLTSEGELCTLKNHGVFAWKQGLLDFVDEYRDVLGLKKGQYPSFHVGQSYVGKKQEVPVATASEGAPLHGLLTHSHSLLTPDLPLLQPSPTSGWC
jgi:hypothetical protein